MKKSIIALTVAAVLTVPMMAQANPLMEDTVAYFVSTSKQCLEQAKRGHFPDVCSDAMETATTLTDMIKHDGLQMSDEQSVRVRTAMQQGTKAMRIIEGR